MEGLKRLDTEVLELNDYNVSAIFNYLKKREDLIDKFDNEEKSLKEMYKYICDQARKKAVNNVAMIDDRIVYLWAVTYFTKSNEELGLKKENVKIKKEDTTKKVEDKQVVEKKEDKKEDNQISMFQEVKN